VRIKPLFSLAALLTCAAASATSPCPPGANCDADEPAVLFAASYTMMKIACSRADPAHKEQYAALAEKVLHGDRAHDEREALRKAMDSPLFKAKLQEAESALTKIDNAELMRECSDFLRSGR
jgi:hypothetical protein